MTIKKPTLLTTEGLERLTQELEHLEGVGREEIAERLQRAFEDGQDDDFVENAELEAARNSQVFLETRIQEIKDILRNYQIIGGKSSEPHDHVRVGDWVTVVEEGFDEEERYHLVGPAEADPAEGRISNESPLGKVLLGRKVGDIVNVNAPNGFIEFRVVKIG
ncbi:MAG: transcription elongation factor GreA [Ardenticatenaceae bacterium]|nr:transcription elongation factor GreA [Ardenticatenaceae bacterium]